VKTQITDLKFALTFPKFSAVSSLSFFSFKYKGLQSSRSHISTLWWHS
jgi:hypothetical protein